MIIAEGLDIAWSSYAHLHGVTDKLARKMYDAGCRTLCFGVESGSNSTLQKMRKIHKISEVEQALSRVNNAGIACDIGLMVGFPGETEEDFQQTLKFVEKIKNLIHEIQSVSLFYVKPLSHVEDYAEQYGISFPEDNTKRWNCWIGDDGSNYQKRLQRARHLLEMIEHSQIKFDKRNFFGF